MKPLKIVLIACACNPDWVLEFYVGYKWFTGLNVPNNVMLITREVNKPYLGKKGIKNTWYIPVPDFIETKKVHDFGLSGYFF